MAYVDIGGYSYSTGAYGSGDFGSANFQTVVTSTSTVDASASRARTSGSIALASVSSSTCGAEKIHQGDGSLSALSTVTAIGAISVTGSATTSASASVEASCNRVLFFDAASSSTLSFSSIAREKWVQIATTSEVWTKIA